jgi:hypothetical protein
VLRHISTPRVSLRRGFRADIVAPGRFSGNGLRREQGMAAILDREG